MYQNIIIEDHQSIRITKVTKSIYNKLKDFILNEDPTIWEIIEAAEFIVRVYQNGIKYDSLPVLFYSAASEQFSRLRKIATISATVDDVDEEYVSLFIPTNSKLFVSFVKSSPLGVRIYVTYDFSSSSSYITIDTVSSSAFVVVFPVTT